MDHANPHSFFKIKSAGKYTLWSMGREPGTLIDQLLLTLDKDFNPEEATQGQPIDILPEAIYSKGKLAVAWGQIKNY